LLLNHLPATLEILPYGGGLINCSTPRLSANEKLTMYFDEFRTARQPTKLPSKHFVELPAKKSVRLL